MQLSPGDRVDHYTLLSPLGEGGQGSVWKVLDPRDGGVMRALKLIALSEAGPAAFDRARREARILAAAKHPALVTCHSFFEEPGAGRVGLVMDLVSGGSLADAVSEERMDRARSLAVLAQVAEVLAYIHGAGLAHRDLKPENVLLTDGFWEDPHRPGRVKLVDFGIAARAGGATHLTAPGAVIGTLPYLAPELVDPATWGRGAGPARDVFALGVLGCALVLGKHPTGLRFDATIIDLARAYKAAQAGVIAWPPEVLEGAWGAALAACLTLRPADRPADGAAVLALLRTGAPSKREPWTGASGPTSPHHAPPSTGSREPRSTPRVVLAGVVPAAATVRTVPAAPAKQVRTVPAAPAQQVRTVPAAPVASAFEAPRARSRSWAGCMLLLLVFVGTCAGVVGMGYQADWIGLAPAPSARATATATTAIQVGPSAQPSPAMPSPAASPTIVGACCPETMSCTGPTTLSRDQCLPCVGRAPALIPGASWQLRVTHAVAQQASLVEGHPDAAIEMRVGGSVQVLPFSAIRDERAAEHRLPVTTEDINGGRVHFKITEGDTILAEGPGRVRTPPVRVSALCAGLYVYVDASGGEPVRLSVYLDP